DPALRQPGGQLGPAGPGRLGRGALDVIALDAGHAQVGHAGQLIQRLDALGDDDGAGNGCDIAYRAQDLLAQQIVVDACGEDLVGLDEFGTQVQPAPQVGKTGPQVVDGELDAPRTQPGHDRGQIGPELALPLLGDLDHQAPGIQSAS